MGAQDAVLKRWRSLARRKRREPAERRSNDAAVTTQIPDSASVARRGGLGHSIDLHADGNERADDRITVLQPNGAVLRREPDDMATYGVTGGLAVSAEGTDAAKPTKVFTGLNESGRAVAGHVH
jgi:hypothetical protein